jgi:hypothetical protein
MLCASSADADWTAVDYLPADADGARNLGSFVVRTYFCLPSTRQLRPRGSLCACAAPDWAGVLAPDGVFSTSRSG